MKKYILVFILSLASISVFAQEQKATAKQQFLLIIRFKKNFVPPTDTAIKVNGKHWQAYMSSLAQSGSLASGYRPGSGGQIISGTQKTITDGPYIANGELVSSVLIINANDMADAKSIADKCPVFEFGGSIEIRPMMNTAGR